MRLRQDTHTTEGLQSERIAKAIARAGVCSRRDAEKLIAEGRVKLNGKTVASPALNVTSEDRIEVDGQPLSTPGPVRLWRYHKPKGRVTTHRDPEGRPTVFEALPPDMPRVISIGRLDLNTEGLLLLTTDGGLARHLESPSTGWVRRYRVRVHGKVEQGALDALGAGLTLDGVRYAPIEAKLDRAQGMNAWLTVSLREGKNREIRKIMEHLGLTVNRLIRLSFGPFALGDLEPGALAEVKGRVLADQLGEEMALSLGLREKRHNPAGHAASSRMPGKAQPKGPRGRNRQAGAPAKTGPRPKGAAR